jgi:hypothetical protein
MLLQALSIKKCLTKSEFRENTLDVHTYRCTSVRNINEVVVHNIYRPYTAFYGQYWKTSLQYENAKIETKTND